MIIIAIRCSKKVVKSVLGIILRKIYMSLIDRKGTGGYHIEILTNGNDDRRHRSRCIYYKDKNKNHCAWYNSHCRGSAHCQLYKEKAVDENKKTDNKAVSARFKAGKLFPVDSRVEHKTFGIGTVKQVEDNGKILVRFDNGKEATLSADACDKSGFLKRI